MKKLSLGLGLLGLLALESEAQITQEQTRPVDSLLVNKYLDSPTFHSYSVLSPSLYVWTAGSGIKDGDYINWTHKGEISTEDFEKANSMPNQYLGKFDLDYFSDVNQYQQAVENWLSELGLPVSVNDFNSLEKKVFPNPTRGDVNLEANIPAGQDYKIRIYDVSGRLIQEYKGITKNNGLNIGLDLSEYSNGMYIINFENKKTTFSKKVLKQ